MKPAFQLRLSQQLTLTPQLQQAIRLLQLSTQDIHQEVARMLDENPMLELQRRRSAVLSPGDSAATSATANTGEKRSAATGR